MSTSGPYTRKNPFPAHLLRQELLSKPGSGKDTRHFEIDLSGSGIQYEPGDSLAVQPLNDPHLAEEIIDILGLSKDEIVGEGDEAKPLFDALVKDYAITAIDPKLLKAIAGANPHSRFGHLLEPAHKEELNRYLYGREVERGRKRVRSR